MIMWIFLPTDVIEKFLCQILVIFQEYLAFLRRSDLENNLKTNNATNG